MTEEIEGVKGEEKEGVGEGGEQERSRKGNGKTRVQPGGKTELSKE